VAVREAPSVSEARRTPTRATKERGARPKHKKTRLTMKILCIGRNYADHAKELNNAVPDSPVVFSKPQTALLTGGKPFFVPGFSQDMHYEGELVLRICKTGKHIQEEFAHRYYDEIGFGIDFTARDVQNKLKAKGLPWELAKAFDGSAVLGDFVSKSDLNLADIHFQTIKNGELVQDGHTRDLIFSFDFLISFVSQYFTLQQGDLIYTGTPAGVGPVQAGDVLEGRIEGRPLMRCEIK
jgi:2-keto-4-pentenoate hydratase/2-oxohepta-3-ene-1,7-dioic acid hydratase in catechol pathway